MLMQSDPRMGKVLEYINQHGGDPQHALECLAKEKGVDPSEALNNARNMVNGIKWK